jgi:uncharacterized membrane protein YkoI
MSKSNLRKLIACLLGGCLLLGGVALAQEREKGEKQEKKGSAAKEQGGEKKMTLKSLPPAVQKTVKEQTQGATIVGISKEVENGQTQYEVETKVNGHAKDFIVAADGKLMDVEEEVALASLPAAVKATIQKEAGQGKILRVETLTKDGTLQCYEAQLQKGAKKSEIQVGTDGKLIPAKK